MSIQAEQKIKTLEKRVEDLEKMVAKLMDKKQDEKTLTLDKRKSA